jgi:hypothetical protein
MKTGPYFFVYFSITVLSAPTVTFSSDIICRRSNSSLDPLNENEITSAVKIFASRTEFSGTRIVFNRHFKRAAETRSNKFQAGGEVSPRSNCIDMTMQ